MKKVFVDEMITWVVQARQVLENAGIPCFIKNEFAGNVAGEVPFTETWPELWVHRDADFEEAKSLLAPLRASRQAQNEADQQLVSWTCPQCGETNEGNFALCWSCGKTLEPAG